MILRRNKSGSWKLRVRVDQGARRVAKLTEIGTGTRSLKTALHCALTAARLYTSLGVIRDTHIRISDPDDGRVIDCGDIEAIEAALSKAVQPRHPAPHRSMTAKRKRRRESMDDPRQMWLDF